MKKVLQSGALALMGLAFAGVVSAHVSVNPKEAVAGFALATVRVPNERDVATTQVRLVIPDGVTVDGVMPLAGWTHTEKREAVKAAAGAPAMSDDGDTAPTDRVTEVTWTGGKIGVGEFMEFPLSVEYSGDMSKVAFKAYQTYAGGEVVAWDGVDEKKPAPEVTILKEAKVDTLEKSVKAAAGPAGVQTPWLSVIAVVLSVAALGMSMNSKKK